MRNMRHLTMLAVVSSICLHASSTAAAEWYLGLAGGETRADLGKLETGYPRDEEPRILRFVTSSSASENHGAWKGLVGVQFAKPVSLEVSYADYGTQSLGYNAQQVYTCIVPPFCVRETRDARRSVATIGIDVVGRVAVLDNVDLIASVGAVGARVRLKTNYTTRIPLGVPGNAGSNAYTSNDATVRLSLGADWKLSPQWVMRLNYEYLDKVGTDFQSDSQPGTGRTGQKTLWFSVMRFF